MSAARVACPLCAGRARLADAPCPRCEDGTVPAADAVTEETRTDETDAAESDVQGV